MLIKPPKRLKKKSVKRLVEKRMAKAIEKYEKIRASSDKAGSSGGNTKNVGRTGSMQGCSHKTFMNENPTLLMEQKSMMTTEYCPATKIKRMEEELWTLTLKGDDIEAYNNRFHELALMCPELVPNENKKIDRYIQVFPKRIKGNITSSRPTTLHDAINMARELVEQAVQGRAARISESNRRKTGHQEKDCRARVLGAGVTPLWDVICYGCGEKGHYKDKCPKGRNQPNEGARASAYVMGTENPQQNPNVVTGTFLLKDHYTCILFDSGAEKSFVSTAFTPFIDIAPVALDTNLLPTRLGSFDVIVGMDWLSYHHAVIVCYEKIVRIPLPNGEILEIQGERLEKDPKLLSCIKADEKKPEDIRIVRDFPDVFPDDLSGLPPVREIEFRIDLIPGALLVVKSPCRLAPLEMLELSNQLKEL
ncbi:putative reverse transcriptase domain-containing protein [Tanacetum coccineum]